MDIGEKEQAAFRIIASAALRKSIEPEDRSATLVAISALGSALGCSEEAAAAAALDAALRDGDAHQLRLFNLLNER